MQPLLIEYSLEKKRCSEYGIKNKGKVSEFSLKMVMLYTGMNEGVAVPEDIQNPNGQRLEQPVLADPALCRGLGLDDFQRSLPNSIILRFGEGTV